MPLVMMVGHPCSGKSTRANALAKYLQEEHKSTVHIISYDSLKLDRNRMYKDHVSEKQSRALFRSAVERHLGASATDVIICDFLNHIKGYRYELWCRARESATQHCTIFCDTEPETCTKWNDERDEKERYDEKIFLDLLRRMEVPNEEKKWDKPLFRVTPSDELPVAAIADVIIKGKTLNPSHATVPQKLEETSYLFELDRITQEVMSTIMSSQEVCEVGDVIKLGPNLSISLSRKLGLPELRRLQRAYLKVAALRPPSGAKQIAASFVEHLNTNL